MGEKEASLQKDNRDNDDKDDNKENGDNSDNRDNSDNGETSLAASFYSLTLMLFILTIWHLHLKAGKFWFISNVDFSKPHTQLYFILVLQSCHTRTKSVDHDQAVLIYLRRPYTEGNSEQGKRLWRRLC